MAEQTSSSITIDAPPADVMAVIADFESYPEWAKGVQEATVDHRDLSRNECQHSGTLHGDVARDRSGQRGKFPAQLAETLEDVRVTHRRILSDRAGARGRQLASSAFRLNTARRSVSFSPPHTPWPSRVSSA